ncbi:MAG: hypothetical protein ACOCZB_06740 [Spirochaetota bacterium]
MEGGFDEEGRFIQVPLSGLGQMTEALCRRLIWLLVAKELLAECSARPPLSFGKVLFHTRYSDYFKENVHLFDVLDFLAEAHLTKPSAASSSMVPPQRVQLIRRCGLYSSRTRGRRAQTPHVAARAPASWRASHLDETSVPEDPGFEPLFDPTMLN